MEAQIATTTALLKASAFLVFILVRAAMDIFSHGVHIYIPVYHWDENSLWLPSPKVVVFSQKEASMLICGENVHSCCVQRRAQTHVKRFHTFACDAVGLQCWVNYYATTPDLHFTTLHYTSLHYTIRTEFCYIDSKCSCVVVKSECSVASN